MSEDLDMVITKKVLYHQRHMIKLTLQ